MPGSVIKLQLQLCIFTAISKHGQKVYMHVTICGKLKNDTDPTKAKAF